jgi:hypothetical protein
MIKAVTQYGGVGNFENFLSEINRNTGFFRPPEDFDPQTADPDLLARYGLPPEPDQRTEPERYAFWRKMLSPPLRFVKAEFSLPNPETQFGRFGLPLALGTRHESSHNWSGAYITPKDNRMFTEVHGSWKVPTPSPPIADKGRRPLDGDYRSSTWIGLDGQRRYIDSSLPQIGTSQCVKVVDGYSTMTTGAWWQWWVPGPKKPPVALSLIVNPGDQVMCSVIVISPTTVRFLIKNQTTGDFVSPFEEPAPGCPAPVRVSGATAQWIMERPMRLANDEFYALPDFGNVVFHDCLAVAAHAPGLAGQSQKLAGAKLINMFELQSDGLRVAHTSLARRSGDQEIEVIGR